MTFWDFFDRHYVIVLIMFFLVCMLASDGITAWARTRDHSKKDP